MQDVRRTTFLLLFKGGLLVSFLGGVIGTEEGKGIRYMSELMVKGPKMEDYVE